MSDRFSFCKHCGTEFKVKGTRGRPPKYCSHACRQNAYVRRKARQEAGSVYDFLDAHDQRCTFCDNGLSPLYMWIDLRSMKPYCGDCYRQLQEEALASWKS